MPGYRIGRLGVRKYRASVQKLVNEKQTMLHYAVVFLVIAIIAAVFGFTGIAGASATIAQILFVLFLIAFVFSLLIGRRRLN